MARYKAVDVRVWNDAKFRNLSPIQPCSQGLWLYLLTCPQGSMIPGCIAAGELGLAESLRWDVKDFRKAFHEVLSQGMAKADLDARFIWLPNAIAYNPPQSPNVVKSWKSAWDELPECDLKVTAWKRFKDFFEGYGEAFQEAFRESCPKPLANQYQYQDQEQNTTPLPPKGGESADADHAAPSNPYTQEFEDFWSEYPRKIGKPKAANAFAAQKKRGMPTGDDLRAILDRHKQGEQWKKDGGQFIPHPTTWLNQGRWEDDVDAHNGNGHKPNIRNHEMSEEDRRFSGAL